MSQDAAHKEIVKRYTKDGVTVIWKPSLCIHSGICARGLPHVFDPRRRPWVVMDGTDVEKIVEQVEECPSGALSYERGPKAES